MGECKLGIRKLTGRLESQKVRNHIPNLDSPKRKYRKYSSCQIPKEVMISMDPEHAQWTLPMRLLLPSYTETAAAGGV